MHLNVNGGRLAWIFVIVAAAALGAATTFFIRPTSKSPPPIQAIDEIGHLVSNHDPRETGGSRAYALSNQGIEAIIPGDGNRTKAIDGAMRVAQERVERAGRDTEVTRSAKQAAEAVVKAVFSATGWTAHIKWE